MWHSQPARPICAAIKHERLWTAGAHSVQFQLTGAGHCQTWASRRRHARDRALFIILWDGAVCTLELNFGGDAPSRLMFGHGRQPGDFLTYRYQIPTRPAISPPAVWYCPTKGLRRFRWRLQIQRWSDSMSSVPAAILVDLFKHWP